RRVQGLEGTGQGLEPGADRRRPQPPAERDSGSLHLRRHSAADPRPGPNGWLPDDGGGPSKPGPGRAAANRITAWAAGECASELVQKGNSNPSLRGLATTFSYRSPQLYLDIDRTKAESLQVQPASVFEALQSYLGSSFVNFFNSFNQVFQVYIQADSRYRLE